jgi:hypothetical protein
MTTLSIKPHVSGMAIPAIRRVGIASPVRWMRLGWCDFRKTWPVSLSYGVAFAVLGWLLMAWAMGSRHLAMTLVSGFDFQPPGTPTG